MGDSNPYPDVCPKLQLVVAFFNEQKAAGLPGCHQVQLYSLVSPQFSPAF